eukprot:10644865-Alexandrium_andersonii.AAC.1
MAVAVMAAALVMLAAARGAALAALGGPGPPLTRWAPPGVFLMKGAAAVRRARPPGSAPSSATAVLGAG